MDISNATSAVHACRMMYPDIPITDADIPFRITITPEMSVACTPGDMCFCPVATGAKQTGMYDEAFVVANFAVLVNTLYRKANRYFIPPSTARLIKEFDSTHRFTPGIYELLPPAPSMKLGQKRGGTGKTSRSIRSTGVRRSHFARHVANIGKPS